MATGHNPLSVEELDQRVLPSTGTFRVFTPHSPPATPVQPVIVYSPPVYHGYRVFTGSTFMIEGSANASFTKITATPTSSATFELNGSAQLFGLGTINLSGVVHAV